MPPHVSPTVWTLTFVLVAGLLLFDYHVHVRKAHVPSLRESAFWSAAYVGIAVLFGVSITAWGRPGMGTEYFAGYITEKALSVDNVFVFLVIMSGFRVPRPYQQKVLLFGVALSLMVRIGLIFLGAALLERYAWVFYLFGLLLLLTAGNLLRPKSDGQEGLVTRLARRVAVRDRHDPAGHRRCFADERTCAACRTGQRPDLTWAPIIRGVFRPRRPCHRSQPWRSTRRPQYAPRH
jgi:tellurite resistance protein TerC